MRIDSIVYPKDPTKFSFCRVVAQAGTGLKVQPLNVPVHDGEQFGEEVELEAGTFHRLDDKKLEKTLQAAYGLQEAGPSLPNPTKPVPTFSEEGGEEELSDDEAEDEEPMQLCSACKGPLNDVGDCDNMSCPSNK